jgi:GNAT superfamily N-acetyltransferase
MSGRSGMTLAEVRIRRMRPGEERRVYRFVKKVFLEFVASQFPRRGRRHFLEFVRPSSLRKLAAENHVLLMAEHRRTGILLGLLDVREGSHISLFFVSGKHQRQGIGRALLEKAVEMCSRIDPGRKTLTVNASPNAVGAYRALGFRRLQPEQEKNGIRYVAMARRG